MKKYVRHFYDNNCIHWINVKDLSVAIGWNSLIMAVRRYVSQYNKELFMTFAADGKIREMLYIKKAGLLEISERSYVFREKLAKIDSNEDVFKLVYYIENKQ